MAAVFCFAACGSNDSDSKKSKEKKEKEETKSLLGTIWYYDNTIIGYDNHCTGKDDIISANSLFSFYEDNKVMWLLEKDSTYILVGLGNYDNEKGIITFSRDKKLCPKDCHPDFKFDANKKTMKVISKDPFECKMFNDGNTFKIKKWLNTLKPSDKLVGSRWQCDIGDGTTTIFFDKRMHAYMSEEDGYQSDFPYVCLNGLYVVLPWGDNFEDENGFGILRGDELEIETGTGFDMCSEKKGTDTFTKIQ